MPPARTGHAQLLDIHDDEAADVATAEDAGEAGAKPTLRAKSAAGKPKDGRLPWLQVLCLLAVTTSEGTVACVLFPFVPYMVADFGLPMRDVGYYAGLLGSAYNLAQFVSGVQWGRASDVWGRKVVLLVGLISSAVTTPLFGMSRSLGEAMLWRCLGGLLNGNTGVGRALMRDITTDATRTRGFSLLGTAYGVGFVIGPTIGGLLSRPADAFPALFVGTIFERFPYLLPCLASTTGCYLALACLCWLRETGRRPAPPVSDTELGQIAPAPADGEQVAGRLRRTTTFKTIGVSLGALALRAGGLCASLRPSALWAIWSKLHRAIDPRVHRTVHCQFALHFVVTAMQELFPLFCASTVHGLGLSPGELGGALAPLGISLLLWPLCIPALGRRIGMVGVFRLGVCLFLLVQIMIPALRLAQTHSASALWAGLIAVALVRGTAGVSR
ncbi:major facilitator superfamily domain-containing protein [Pavlovales sp. CCMP2436]|nr:major facilitator superfamily domain-containing protein [Pavlovales sp. CCMP2436]